ncbi:MAG: hypothetical protein KGM42_00680 [Hyphomicrobiales bacterium]|nr:hypothetical protein [Rhodoblastus sp.]MDE2361162.1 hypothetical protein [Hyphomicrobiales bacterium]HPG01955.1 hypothetical protein [Rhodoblastus sp.]HRY01619.1 hypothetical protein [Beijerinckiaceae bacterium]
MKMLLAGALCLLLAACAQPAPPQFVRAADASVSVGALSLGNATAGTTDFRPASPGDWGAVNRRVTPKPKEAQP